jgi:hypothetical protein
VHDRALHGVTIAEICLAWQWQTLVISNYFTDFTDFFSHAFKIRNNITKNVLCGDCARLGFALAYL